MVTKINRPASKMETKVTESEADHAGRAQRNNETAGRLSIESAAAKQAAFASAISFALLYGHLRFVNDLFARLSRDDKEIMRAYALSELAVQFDPEARFEVDSEGKERWTVRPVSFLEFKAKPDEGKPHISWAVHEIKDSDNPTIQETKRRRKATKQAATKALHKNGETVFAFEWIRESRIGSMPTEFTNEKFLIAMSSNLKKAAKLKEHGKPVYSRDELTRMGAVLKLTQKEITSIQEIWDSANAIPSASSDNKPEAAEDNEGERKVA